MKLPTFVRRGLVACVLVACSKSPVKPASQADAGAASAPVAKETDPNAEQRKLVVDLVYATKTLVAVSSKVKNPRDYPEHLIDGKQETAWNGETDDLKGWIAFRVPKDAHVDYLTITAGFDKIAKDGVDLFTANHRIKKLLLERDGVKVGEHTLDPNLRTPQKIDVDKDGGEFKLKVLETVPGTNAKWRELVVSEFHVMGKTPDITRGIGERPRVFVGSFDAHDNEIDPPNKSMKGPFPDLATYCRTQRALAAPTLPAQMKQHKEMGMDLKLVPMCEEEKPKTPLVLSAPFHELSTVRYETGDAIMQRVVVRTDAGWQDLPCLEVSIDSHYDPGCFSIFRGAGLPGAKVVDGPVPVLLLRWSLYLQYSIVSYGMSDVVVIKVQACRLAGGTIACDEPMTVNQTVVEKGSEKKLKWRKDAKYTITPDGHVRWAGPPSGPLTDEDPDREFFGLDAGSE